MRAIDILKEKGGRVVTVEPDATIGEAIGTLSAMNIGVVVVTGKGGELHGILSERDIIRCLDGAPTGYRETKVDGVMTRSLHTCGPHAEVDELLTLMTDKRIRHVPVLENGALIGLLSIGDVVKRKIRAAEGEAAALKEYIAAG